MLRYPLILSEFDCKRKRKPTFPPRGRLYWRDVGGDVPYIEKKTRRLAGQEKSVVSR